MERDQKNMLKNIQGISLKTKNKPTFWRKTTLFY